MTSSPVAPPLAAQVQHLLDINLDGDQPYISDHRQPVCWRGFMVAINFTWEIAAKVGLYAVLGVAALIFIPCLAAPFFTVAGTAFLSRLAVKLLDPYNFDLVNDLKQKAYNLVTAYNKILIIGMIAAVILSFISTILGVLVAAPLGAFTGFLMGIQIMENAQHEDRQGLRENALDDPISIL